MLNLAMNANFDGADPSKKNQRQLQIGENLKRNLANIFFEENLNNFAGCYLTITEADVSPDARNAKIFVDVFLQKELSAEQELEKAKEESFIKQAKSIVNELNKNSGRLRHLLSKSVKLRYMPEIKFYLDLRQQQLAKVNKLLNQ
jgi:ribosome-binding factor A